MWRSIMPREGSTMNTRVIAGILLAAAVGCTSTAWGAVNVLLNGSMESGDGAAGLDPFVPADWTRFGAVIERSAEANLVPAGSGHALKAFASEPQEGAYQEVPAVPGQSVSASASMFSRSADLISGDAQAGIVLEFYNSLGNLLGSSNIDFAMNGASPGDTWIPASVGPAVAPAGTVVARMTCVWVWSGSATGSAYWDDCSLNIDGGANLLLNGDFEQAGVGSNSPNGIDDWQGFEDQRKSSDFADHGNFSVRMGSEATFSGLFQSMGTLIGGERILLKARVYHSSADPLDPAARAGIKLEFSPPQGGTLPPPEENLPFGDTSPQDSWEFVEISTNGLLVPDGATIARVVMIYAGQALSTGAVYFDSAFAELASAPAVNQLTNASFENGPGGLNGIDDWTEFGGSATAQKSVFEVPGENGLASVKAQGTDFSGVFQEIAVTPGDTLDVTAFLRMASTNPMVSASAGVKVEWVGGTVPPDVDITPGASNNTIVAASPTDQWIDLFVDFTMPPGTEADGQLTTLMASGGALTGAAYFDSCEAIVLNRFDGADSDGDNDQDLFDFAGLQNCYSGSGVTPLEWSCTVFDNDDDDDIDELDYQFFEPRLTGP